MKTIKIIALAFILVLALQNVIAFGVTPGRTTIPYNNAEKEFFFTVINSDAEDIDLKFSTSGELGEHILLDETSYSMNASEKYKLFRFTLDIDDRFASPGMYEGKINIEKIAKQGEGFGVGLILTTQVALKVTESNILLKKEITEVQKDDFTKEEEFKMEEVNIFNAVILILLLFILILVLLNKFIKRK